MASISITVGSWTGSVTGTDVKAQEVLTYFLRETGGPVDGTNQEKIDWVAHRLREYIVMTALVRKLHDAEQEARNVTTLEF